MKPKPIFLKRFVLLIVLHIVCLGASDVYAQYESEKDASIPLDYFYVKRTGTRKLLSKITFGLSTGYGSTKFKHELEGFGILQNPNELPRIFNAGDIASGYSNWVNTVTPLATAAQPGAFIVNADTARIGFKSKAFSIPLKATLHVEFDRYRIGGGYSIEFMHLGDFKPLTYANDIGTFKPEASSFFLQKYFGMIGGSVYRYYEYLLVVDANIGGYKLGNDFDKSLIKKGVFINLGVAAEREFSEYFRVFVRPSYEIKGYKLNVPESGQSINHRMNAFYVNIGATYRFPELRRCPIKGCHAQLNHAHGNREYRSRKHPIYKKQNPHYGENYPTLIKYKGKNKKKLNPY
ncbi:MAG: hypothetical protein JNM57_07285 [Cyclobacteriaceae bacterium]|nr:hypothetical protein [Cyclobacteriaceae bacterium]